MAGAFSYRAPSTSIGRPVFRSTPLAQVTGAYGVAEIS